MSEWSDWYLPDDPITTPPTRRYSAMSLAAFCEQFGIATAPKFREYEPTDEDKRILSELGIEA